MLGENAVGGALGSIVSENIFDELSADAVSSESQDVTIRDSKRCGLQQRKLRANNARAKQELAISATGGL
jgi:hypothetical protein